MTAPATVGRLAPTPSGPLHLGNARSFLLAWLWARSRGGRVVLRIEDVDAARSRPELRDAAIRDLEWLGLDWDEGPRAGEPPGPWQQSTRGAAYRAALARLAAAGLAYPCSCSRRDVEEAASAPHGDEGAVYPGTCRDRWRDPSAARAGSGREPAWRFRWDGPRVAFADAVAGETVVDPAALGDFVVWRREDSASYQLAVVVDDDAQRVTQVLRGRDLLWSTARQLALHRALGLRAPREWAHVPLLRRAGGERLAKRAGDEGLAALRAAGVEARAVVGFLARSAGLVDSAGPVSPAELVSGFDLARLRREDTVVDPASLRRR